MKLAICCVYLLDDEDGPLLDLHLRWIERFTSVPYVVYGSVDRLLPQFREVLGARSDVRVLDFGGTSERGGREHSHYMTLLTYQALEDGATHIAHLHVDSFPVRERWAEDAVEMLESGGAYVGATMTELGETTRPRTFGMFVPGAFYEQHGPIGTVMELDRSDPAYEEYRAPFQAGDSSDAYAYVVHKHGLRWHALPRSNAVDDHYAMGGVYGDTFFHLGAAARARKGFVPQAVQGGEAKRPSLVRRLARRLIPSGLRDSIPDSLRKVADPTHQKHSEESGRVYAQIRERLLSDPDGYLAYLRGR